MKTRSSATFCPVFVLVLACASGNAPPGSPGAEAPPPAPVANAAAAPPAASGGAASSSAGGSGSIPHADGFDTPPEAPPTPKAETIPKGPAKMIQATVQAKSGSKLKGTVVLTEKTEGVRIRVELEGVRPGEHGAHIHERADCSAADGSSAGGHFNPQGHDHGLPDKETRHLGDLGNITIDKEGKGIHEIMIAGANLKDIDPHSFVGRALIVHEKKDDGGQPVGNAGGRIGCAEIK